MKDGPDDLHSPVYRRFRNQVLLDRRGKSQPVGDDVAEHAERDRLSKYVGDAGVESGAALNESAEQFGQFNANGISGLKGGDVVEDLDPGRAVAFRKALPAAVALA